MGLLDFLSQVFINTFGITQPQPAQRGRIAKLLGGFILGTFLVILAVAGFFLYQLPRGR